MSGIRLDGIAIITGAAIGIGAETTYLFAEAGVQAVVLADLNIDGAKEVAEKSKQYASNPAYRTLVVALDVTNEESVKSMVETTVKEFGRIDYCINSAGVTGNGQSVKEIDVDGVESTININTLGIVRCIKHVSAAMAKQELGFRKHSTGKRSLGRGSIVNLASGHSFVAVPGVTSYATSKHAVMGVTKTAALDLAPDEIRVNAVCPSWVNGPRMEGLFKVRPDLREYAVKASPFQRMCEADEVAEAVAFLASPGASFINGTYLMVDAGTTLSCHV